jgi:hypothetical protein
VSGSVLSGLKMYLSGAFVASAPLIGMALVVSLANLELQEAEIALITVSLVVLGSVLGGFLVAEKASVSDYRSSVLVGGITGLFSFLFSVVYFLVILQIYTGSIRLLASFLIGGCLGGVLNRLTKGMQTGK